jgi:hypothetical protein
MNLAVVRMHGLTTQYLHQQEDGTFAWQDERIGRHSFDNQEDADRAAATHRGLVAHIDEPPHKPEHKPEHKPAIPEPPARDWLSKWELDHDA